MDKILRKRTTTESNHIDADMPNYREVERKMGFFRINTSKHEYYYYASSRKIAVAAFEQDRALVKDTRSNFNVNSIRTSGYNHFRFDTSVFHGTNNQGLIDVMTRQRSINLNMLNKRVNPSNTNPFRLYSTCEKALLRKAGVGGSPKEKKEKKLERWEMLEF